MGKVLDLVTHHPYLDVELSRNLNWGQHVNNKVMKANLSLGFLRRNLSSCPERVKEAAYKAIVRPRVEYASSVWDPYLKKHVKQMEGVQRRAARFVKKLLHAGTRNSYKPLERIKLDTNEGTKNNLAVNLVPQSNSWWWRPGVPRLCYEAQKTFKEL